MRKRSYRRKENKKIKTCGQINGKEKHNKETRMKTVLNEDMEMKKEKRIMKN